MINTQSSGFSVPVHRQRVLAALAGHYAMTYAGTSATVDPAIIAKQLGLKVIRNDYGDDFEGLLSYSNGKFCIHLNTQKYSTANHPRFRFTFAHELGHYIIDEHRMALMSPGMKPHGSFPLVSQDLLIEREADLFASCLLMPESRIAKDIASRKFGIQLINDISSTYNVSVTAVVLRFIALDFRPLMIICSRNGNIVWHRETEDFRYKIPLFGHKGKVPVNTVAGEFYNMNIMRNTTEIIHSRDWFLLPKTDTTNRKMYEHCFYFKPMNQVISVVWED